MTKFNFGSFSDFDVIEENKYKMDKYSHARYF